MESQLNSMSSSGIWRYWIGLVTVIWVGLSGVRHFSGRERVEAGSRWQLLRCPRSNQTSQSNHETDAGLATGFNKKPALNSGLGITTGHQREVRTIFTALCGSKPLPFSPTPLSLKPYLVWLVKMIFFLMWSGGENTKEEKLATRRERRKFYSPFITILVQTVK